MTTSVKCTRSLRQDMKTLSFNMDFLSNIYKQRKTITFYCYSITYLGTSFLFIISTIILKKISLLPVMQSPNLYYCSCNDCFLAIRAECASPCVWRLHNKSLKLNKSIWQTSWAPLKVLDYWPTDRWATLWQWHAVCWERLSEQSLSPDYLRWSPEPEADMVPFTNYIGNTGRDDTGISRFTWAQLCVLKRIHCKILNFFLALQVLAELTQA